MRTLLTAVVLFAVMALPFTAQAQEGVPVKFDLGALGLTDLFDRITIGTIDATSSYAAGIFPGATFTDTGDFQGSGITRGGAGVDDKGMNTSWELTGRWTGLTGTLTSITPVGPTTFFDFVYSGGTVDIYAAQGVDKNVVPASFGGVGSDDDIVAHFTDGLKIATLSLISGNGILGITAGFPAVGGTQTTWAFVDAAPAFWLDAAGNDLEALLESDGILKITTNVTSVSIIDGDGDGVPDTILSRNTGAAVIPVPEPTTMLLLGSGLLGLAGLRKRKRRA